MAKRAVWTISISTGNPDAVTVTEALVEVPRGERSALLLRWAAAFLTAPALVIPPPPVIEESDLGLSEDDIDAALDDW